MEHELQALDYEMDALAPFMSKETLEFHYAKHHRTYIDNLNKLIPGTKYADMTLYEIVRYSDGGIFNNAAQAQNHNLFWKILTPNKETKPSDALRKAVDASFGSYEEMKEQFNQAAITTFGSGWAWLIRNDDGTLSITSTSNADTPCKDGKTAILNIDVWEHAYYIDYRNARPKYLEAFWNIVNWEKVSELYGD
jgi:Fe-Mn family superoxide dismutase